MATVTFAVLILVFVTGIFAQSPLPPSSAGGDPCETRISCGESLLIREENQPCQTCSGPNVCFSNKTYRNQYESGFYKEYCHDSWFGQYCRLECVSTLVCNVTKYVTQSGYDCCPGYVTDPATDDYHRFISAHSNMYLQQNGCPKALNESVSHCLELLGLSQISHLIKQTKLEATLRKDTSSKFTIFAPTNEAIARSSLSELSQDDLLTVLKSHVIQKTLTSKRLFRSFTEETLASDRCIHFHSEYIYNWFLSNSQKLYANGRQVLSTDSCLAVNGVVHIVDDVIDSSDMKISQVVKNTSDLSTMSSLLDRRPDVLQWLNGSCCSRALTTFFVPTDAAFRRGSTELGIDIVRCLSASKNMQALKTFLNYHIVCEGQYTVQLKQKTRVTTLACQGPQWWNALSRDCDLPIMSTDNGIYVDRTGSMITGADMPACNGVIHTVSLPLVAPSLNLRQLCAEFTPLQ